MKKFLSVLLVAVMVFSMVGCGSKEEPAAAPAEEATEPAAEEPAAEEPAAEEPAAEEPTEAPAETIKIGFSPYTLANEYFSAVEAGVKAACDELGYEMISNDPQSDSTVQAKQIDDMIAQGISGLVYIPNDSKNCRSVLEACKAAGVFVINVDNVITEDDYDVVDGIIASDNHQLGYLSGKYVAGKATEGGKVLIVHLQTAESCAVNVQGFWDGLKENAAEGAEFEEVQVVEGGGATDIAYKAVSDALSAHPDITIIYAINDTSAQGAIQAVAEAGLEDQIMVVGKDAAPLGKQNIKDGKQVQSSGQRPSQMGYDGVYSISDLLAGKEIEFNVAIEAYDCSADNIDDFDLAAWDEIEHR